MRACVWGAPEVWGDSGFLVVGRRGGGMGIAEFWELLIYYPTR